MEFIHTHISNILLSAFRNEMTAEKFKKLDAKFMEMMALCKPVAVCVCVATRLDDDNDDNLLCLQLRMVTPVKIVIDERAPRIFIAPTDVKWLCWSISVGHLFSALEISAGSPQECGSNGWKKIYGGLQNEREQIDNKVLIDGEPFGNLWKKKEVHHFDPTPVLNWTHNAIIAIVHSFCVEVYGRRLGFRYLNPGVEHIVYI